MHLQIVSKARIQSRSQSNNLIVQIICDSTSAITAVMQASLVLEVMVPVLYQLLLQSQELLVLKCNPASTLVNCRCNRRNHQFWRLQSGSEDIAKRDGIVRRKSES
jgi:hypothetical protein